MAMSSETSPLLQAEPASEQAYPSALDSETLDHKGYFCLSAASFLLSAAPSSSASSTESFSFSSSHPTASSFDLGDALRDVIIGFSDGLTVPFALTAGLSSLGSSRLVIMGGLAELFSGMISMGLGAYLAAVTERDRYHSVLRLEKQRRPTAAANRCADLYALLAARYGLSRSAARPLVEELAADRQRWLRFKMDVGLRMDEPHGLHAWLSGLVMGLSYFIGGLIPMLPYFFFARVRDALLVSIATTVLILLAFGYAKNYLAIKTHRAGVWGAVQTLIIGVLAAGTSYVIVKALDGSGFS